MLQRVAPLNQRAGNLPDAVGVTVLAEFLGVNAGFRGGNDEEILDGLGHEAAFLGLDRLADDRRQVEFLLRKPLQGGFRDLPESGRVDFPDDPVGDGVLVGPPCVEVAEELLQEVGGEDLADHVEDLVGPELVADLAQPLQELLEHAAFAGVTGHEVENDAVVLLAVPVDAADPLLEPDGVPRDVVVDHLGAELEVDPFARGLGGDEHLGGFAELPLGIDAAPRRVAVADLHPAVDLGDGEAPLPELAVGAAVFAVADEEVERVLVLGEEQKLLLRVGEEALVLENALQLGELRLDFPLFENAGLVDELGQAGDFDPEGGRVHRSYHVFKLGDDLLLLVFGKLVEVVGNPLLDLLLPVGFGVGQDLLAPLPHPFQAFA